MPVLLPEHETQLGLLSEKRQAYVLGNLVLYIFHGCDQSDIREALASKNIEFNFLSWRRALHTNGLLLRDGKLYLYAKIAKKPLELDTLGLSEQDVSWLNAAYRYRPLRDHLRQLLEDRASHCRVLSAAQFDRFIGRVLGSEDLVAYTRKFIKKKMSFLMKSYNLESGDIENTLKANALYGLHRAYPRFENVGHGVAIAKTLIKRSGINFMKELTSQKQNALLQNKDTGAYSKATVSLDSIADSTGQFLTEDGTFVHRSLLVVGLNGANTQDGLSWDMKFSLRELCSSNILKTRQRQFLSLMLGNHHEEFSAWLGCDNDDLIEQVSYSKYLNDICQFMSIEVDTAKAFLSKLKPQLGGKVDSQVFN